MLLRVKACSVCKHLCDRRWKELRRVGKSWEGEKNWDELRKRWDELSGGEKRWKELRRGGKRWEELRRVEKSWEEVGRGESGWEELRSAGKRWKELSWGGKRWNNFESCWKELRELRRAEMVWEEMRSGHNWKGVRQDEDEFTEQNWEAVRVRCISYRQTLSLDPIASQFLNLETSATRLARVLLVHIQLEYAMSWDIMQ